jgi:hypothetical protein
VVDLITDSKTYNDNEIQILEPPPIPTIDLVIDSEGDVVPLFVPLARDIVTMLIDDASDKNVEIPRKMGKVVMAWGKLQKTARRTKGTENIRVNLERPIGEPEYFGFINGRDVGFTKRIGRFYEPGPSNVKKD